MKTAVACALLLSITLRFPALSQEAESSAVAAEPVAPARALELDTVQTIESAKVVVVQPKVARYNYDAIPKDPVASAAFSLTLPGAGQIYNREYVRGIVTAAVFYSSGITFNYLINRWTLLNTDTFYVEEVDAAGLPTGNVRRATALREDDDQVGLPPGEKVLLLTSGALAIASYVFGLVDSIKGAKRYNQRLILGRLDNFDVKVSGSVPKKKLGMQVSCDF